MLRKACLCVALLVLVAMVGWGRGQQDVATEAGPELTPVGTLPIVTEPLTLDFFANADPYVTDVSTNDFTLYLQEKTNIHIQWSVVPGDVVQERLALELAAGDLPDVIWGAGLALGAAGETRYGVQEEIFTPLNDLIETEMINLPSALDRFPELVPMITAVDGNIYGLPKIEVCTHCEFALKLWMNHPWLEALGLDVPTTTEEFYEVLKAFKENDPNSSGTQDEIPLTGSVDGWNAAVHPFLMNAFIYDSGHPVGLYTVDETTVRTNVNDPRYREGLRYINRLYSEGLVHAAAFTQTDDQLRALVNADPVRVGAVTHGATIIIADVTGEAYRSLFTIPPLEGPDGLRVTTFFPQGGTTVPLNFIVTVDNEHPRASVRWADLFYDVWFQARREYGEEGVDWRRADPGETTADGRPALLKMIRLPIVEPQNRTWTNFGIEFKPSEWNDQVAEEVEDMFAPTGPAFGTLLHEATEVYKPYQSDRYGNPPELKLTPEESDELRTIIVELETYITESRVRFATGDLDLDQDWDQYVRALDAIGLQRYLEVMQLAYTRQTR